MAKLSDLRALLSSTKPVSTSGPAAAPKRPANRSKRAIAQSKHADADIDLTVAFADVEPLAPRNYARLTPPPPSTLAVKRLADEADALAASRYEAEPSSWEIGQEVEGEQTFLRPGLGNDVLSKLRRGHWVAQGELDLHRLTSDEARFALADFLIDARARGWRCVRVIHGKGLSSPNREPILKGRVRRWLARWDDVLAYCEAPRNAGGSGAVIVLLKAQSA